MVVENEQQRSPFFFLFPILFLFCSYEHRPKTGIQCLVWTDSLRSLFWGGFLISCFDTEFFPCAVFLWLPISLSFFWSVFQDYFFICFFAKVFLGVIRRLSFQKKWKCTNTNECNLLSDSIFDFENFLFLFLFICVFYLRLPWSAWPYWDLEWNHGKSFVLPCAFPCFFFESLENLDGSLVCSGGAGRWLWLVFDAVTFIYHALVSLRSLFFWLEKNFAETLSFIFFWTLFSFVKKTKRELPDVCWRAMFFCPRLAINKNLFLFWILLLFFFQVSKILTLEKKVGLSFILLEGAQKKKFRLSQKEKKT